MRLYADYNATAPMRDCAKLAFMEAIELAGNASSLHSEGRKARGLLENARRVVAESFAIRPDNVYFTAGATESANWALLPAFTLQKQAPTHLIYSAGEHPAIQEGHGFINKTQIGLLPSGVIDVAALEAALKANSRAMVAVQAANNETGVIQPVSHIALLCNQYEAIFVCDAVQAVGKMPLLNLTGADVLLISAHKFGGAKGVGAMLVSSPRVELCASHMKGGGQEARRRSGTENVAGIHAMGVALAQALNDNFTPIRDIFEKALDKKLTILGQNMPRLSNTTCLLLEGISAETALIKLDLMGAAVSSGSACSSGKIATSSTLKAMGYEGAQALRVSWGHGSTSDEAQKLANLVNRLLI